MRTGPMTYAEAWVEHLSSLTHEEQMVNAAAFLRSAADRGERRGADSVRVCRRTISAAADLLDAAARRLEARE